MVITAAPSIFKKSFRATHATPHDIRRRRFRFSSNLPCVHSSVVERPPLPPHFGAPRGLRFEPSFSIRLSFSHLLHYVASLAVHFFMRTLRDVAEDFVFIYLTSTI
jgi:hypothetical protein